MKRLAPWNAPLAVLALALIAVPNPNQTHGLPSAGPTSSVGDCPAQLVGPWQTTLALRDLFTVTIVISQRSGGSYMATVRSREELEETPVWRQGERLRFQSASFPIGFDGKLNADSGSIAGFVRYGSTIVHTELDRADASGAGAWMTHWNLLGTPAASARFDLYVESGDDGGMAGYFFFRDQRLPALWGYGLECRDGKVRLGERNLGLQFEGQLDSTRDVLDLTATGVGGSLSVTFRRMAQSDVPELPDAPTLPPRRPPNAAYVERAPEANGDGWLTATPSDEGLDTGPIREMVRAIAGREMTLTHGVLVARHGRLVVEEYFHGFDRDTWHDMRSASKTVTSALVGLAIDERQIPSADVRAVDFFDQYRQYANWDPRKADITVRDLLRMSSGLDANDSDPSSVASEGAYQSQTARSDWVKFALDAPMIADPGAQSLYGSANPLVLGGILEEALDEPVEWFAHRTLFGPLGISKYRFLVDPMGIVYMGGGLYLRPRDMAKFGQLYLDGGVWQGRRVISEQWVRESTGKYGRLAPLDRNGHQYGYLWWHHAYPVGDRVIESIEARGAGGQYIFVVPALDLVAVITSGNFRNGRYRQPEEILRRFILPAVLQSSEPN